jgi:hypothetical protein
MTAMQNVIANFVVPHHGEGGRIRSLMQALHMKGREM